MRVAVSHTDALQKETGEYALADVLNAGGDVNGSQGRLTERVASNRLESLVQGDGGEAAA